jgi:hypothetical protein
MYEMINIITRQGLTSAACSTNFCTCGSSIFSADELLALTTGQEEHRRLSLPVQDLR